MHLWGASVTELAPRDAQEAIDWLVGTVSRPDVVPAGLRWAIAQATDALVWGVCRDETWRWATQAADPQMRVLRAEALVEIRAFSAAAELLLWPGEGAFCGRILSDVIEERAPGPNEARGTAISPVDRWAYFLPAPDEGGIVSGQVTLTADPDFLRREEGNGRITVTPAGSGVLTRNYLEQCSETGALRIAATRFHSIF